MLCCRKEPTIGWMRALFGDEDGKKLNVGKEAGAVF